MSEEPQKTHRKTFSWRWVLFGLALVLTTVWLTLTPDGLLGKAHAVGYAVCHQISARSFQIFGQSMPLCARCSGMFTGAILGLIYQVVQGRKGKMPPVPVMVLLGLMALAWILDGTNSFTMLIPGIPSVYETQNWTRLVTGTGMGMALSAILLPSFIQTVFVHWEEESALGNWKQVLGLLGIAAVMDVLILLEIPWILYPIALISSAGVLVLLTMVYTMVLVMLTKKDNTFTKLNFLVNHLIGGYIIALLQVGVFDLLRYLWTGTWAGFVL
ncbi:MAG: DUF2085 domain-containing protein [Anaerolineaceae bacterium]|nr:DUF2085 domain-containing protein [Anaerolineaceae bacterium]